MLQTACLLGDMRILSAIPDHSKISQAAIRLDVMSKSAFLLHELHSQQQSNRLLYGQHAGSTEASSMTGMCLRKRLYEVAATF